MNLKFFLLPVLTIPFVGIYAVHAAHLPLLDTTVPDALIHFEYIRFKGYSSLRPPSLAAIHEDHIRIAFAATLLPSKEVPQASTRHATLLEENTFCRLDRLPPVLQKIDYCQLYTPCLSQSRQKNTNFHKGSL